MANDIFRHEPYLIFTDQMDYNNFLLILKTSLLTLLDKTTKQNNEYCISSGGCVLKKCEVQYFTCHYNQLLFLRSPPNLNSWKPLALIHLNDCFYEKTIYTTCWWKVLITKVWTIVMNWDIILGIYRLMIISAQTRDAIYPQPMNKYKKSKVILGRTT